MPNDDQIASWDGNLGQHWVSQNDRYTRMLGEFVQPLLDAAIPSPGERVIDVGCGSGDLTLELGRPVTESGDVLGIDVSGPMLELARARAEEAGLTQVRFARGDAQVFPFPGAFDLIISRFGVMFFENPVAAFTNLRAAVRSGGRIAFACWQDMFANEWMAVPVVAALDHLPVPDTRTLDGPGPFSLADPDQIRSVLTDAGFSNCSIRETEQPMHLGVSVEDVVDFMHQHEFAEILFAGATSDAQERAWAAVGAAFRPYADDDSVTMLGRAWIVTAVAEDC